MKEYKKKELRNDKNEDKIAFKSKKEVILKNEPRHPGKNTAKKLSKASAL